MIPQLLPFLFLLVANQPRKSVGKRVFESSRTTQLPPKLFFSHTSKRLPLHLGGGVIVGVGEGSQLALSSDMVDAVTYLAQSSRYVHMRTKLVVFKKFAMLKAFKAWRATVKLDISSRRYSQLLVRKKLPIPLPRGQTGMFDTKLEQQNRHTFFRCNRSVNLSCSLISSRSLFTLICFLSPLYAACTEINEPVGADIIDTHA